MVKLEITLNLGRRSDPLNHAPNSVAAEAITARKKRSKPKKAVLIVSVLIIAIAATSSAWWFFIRPRAIINPFSARLAASVQFPLYYATNLPRGFRVDPKSVTEPQSDVVVYDAVGPDNAKLYISEEPRPSTFNFGGYYKGFANLHQQYGAYGSLATGRVDYGRTAVGSLTNNKVWIIANTTANIPLDQIATMLTTMALNQ